MIAKSEEKHKNLFVELGYEYFDKAIIDQRLEEILLAEADLRYIHYCSAALINDLPLKLGKLLYDLSTKLCRIYLELNSHLFINAFTSWLQRYKSIL